MVDGSNHSDYINYDTKNVEIRQNYGIHKFLQLRILELC